MFPVFYASPDIDDPDKTARSHHVPRAFSTMPFFTIYHVNSLPVPGLDLRPEVRTEKVQVLRPVQVTFGIFSGGSYVQDNASGGRIDQLPAPGRIKLGGKRTRVSLRDHEKNSYPILISFFADQSPCRLQYSTAWSTPLLPSLTLAVTSGSVVPGLNENLPSIMGLNARPSS